MKKLLMITSIVAAFSGMLYGHLDVSSIISEYQGAQSCTSCHYSGASVDAQAMARQIAGGAHFKFKADVGADNVYVYDGDSDLSNDIALTGEHGKINRYCGLPGSVPEINWLGLVQDPALGAANPTYPNGLPGGCSRCHVSTGAMTPDLIATDDAWKNVDCLLCHAATYQLDGVALNNYGDRMPVADAGSATGFRLPYMSGTDLSVTSTSIVRKPGINNCQNCHAWAGGAYTAKRGFDYDGSYGSNPIQDQHASVLVCVDCHIVKEHQIGMGRTKPGLWASDLAGDPDNDKIACAFCHSTDGQAYYTDLPATPPIPTHPGIPSKHFESLDCQSCHIPNNLGMDFKYFDELVKEVDANSNFVCWKPKGNMLSGQGTLSYKWYNGSVYTNVTPRGAQGDGKIHPFRIMTAKVPVDQSTGIILPIKLGIIFGANEAISNFTAAGVTAGDSQALIEKAIRDGATAAKAKGLADYSTLPVDGSGNYNGTITWENDVMNFSVDHGVQVKEDALKCVDCHGVPGGRIDWTALGFSANPYPIVSSIENKSSIPANFDLKQNYPNPFNPLTRIDFNLPARSHAILSIYSIDGQRVDTPIDTELSGGSYSLEYDGGNLASGIYFYRLSTSDGYGRTMKFTVLK